MEEQRNDLYISSISEYLDRLEELGSAYPNNSFMPNTTSHTFLFRGMADSGYKLLPSIYREVEYKGEGPSIFNAKYLTFSNERSILEHFKQDASAYVSQFDTRNDVRWAELAQHHGVPTRFLDWTENPLVALYFACESNKHCDAVVWVLHKRNYLHYANEHDENRFQGNNPYATNEDAIQALLTISPMDGVKYAQLWKLPLVYTPYYFDHRMSAQSSWFMVWGTKRKPLEDLVDDSVWMQYQPPADGVRLSKVPQEDRFLCRFLIHQSEKQAFIRQLDRMGVHAKSLFPGLDGVGKRIERTYRFDYGEMCRNF